MPQVRTATLLPNAYRGGAAPMSGAWSDIDETEADLNTADYVQLSTASIVSFALTSAALPTAAPLPLLRGRWHLFGSDLPANQGGGDGAGTMYLRFAAGPAYVGGEAITGPDLFSLPLLGSAVWQVGPWQDLSALGTPDQTLVDNLALDISSSSGVFVRAYAVYAEVEITLPNPQRAIV